jgi:hypothetical protein
MKEVQRKGWKNEQEPARSTQAAAGTDMPKQAGAEAEMDGDRSMDYLSKKGTQKTHPAKPSQPNVLRYLG